MHANNAKWLGALDNKLLRCSVLLILDVKLCIDKSVYLSLIIIIKINTIAILILHKTLTDSFSVSQLRYSRQYHNAY